MTSPVSDPLGEGPWNEGPDTVSWVDEATGLRCLARRTPAKIWCGYVAVPPGHEQHGKHYDAVDVAVHGGLTFSDYMTPEDEDRAGPWWLGFDCGHFGDLIPGESSFGGGEYRTLDYVRDECAKLAGQLAPPIIRQPEFPWRDGDDDVDLTNL